MIERDIAETLDVKGQNCPMPVVKAKQAIHQFSPDDVLEVLATDSGSINDLAGWAETPDGVTTGVGAATAVQDLAEADIQLLVRLTVNHFET